MMVPAGHMAISKIGRVRPMTTRSKIKRPYPLAWITVTVYNVYVNIGGIRTMKKVVAYCRVSTLGQTGDDKFGISAQKEQVSKYCSDHGLEVVDWYIDEGISGAEKDRPAFGKLLEGAVTNPPVEAVVVAKADRIARDVELYYTFKGMLRKRGLEIISISEDWSSADRLTGMIIENVFAMMGEIERVNIKYRTTAGRKLKANTGGYSGGKAPYGYMIAGGKYVVNEKEAEAVRLIFSLRDQEYTMYEILDELKKKGYKSRKGKDIALSTLQSILNNRKTYEGYYHYKGMGNGEIWVKGQHQALISERHPIHTEEH